MNDAADAASTPHTAIAVPHVARAFGFATQVRQTLAVAGRSFREIMAGRGWVLPVGVSVVVVVAGPELMEHLGVPLVPATSRVIDVLAALELQRLVVALTVIYAGELVWKERDAGLHTIADATPVPDGVLLGGKLLGLGLGIVAFQALLMATGIAIQARMGYYDVEPGLYARILFGFQFTDYLLFAVLAVGVHVLVNQKYVGHLVVLLAYVFTLFPGALGVEVEEDERELSLVAVGPHHLAAESLVKEALVEEPRERVGLGLRLEDGQDVEHPQHALPGRLGSGVGMRQHRTQRRAPAPTWPSNRGELLRSAGTATQCRVREHHQVEKSEVPGTREKHLRQWRHAHSFDHNRGERGRES